MSYTFRVVFEGVCAYVPEKPFFKKDEEKDYWETQPEPIRSVAVLLPDLRRPGKPCVPKDSRLYFPDVLDPHFPLLKFRLGDLREGTTRRVDLVCRDISEKDEEGVLFLRREQIRFTVDAENGKKFSFAGWAPEEDEQKKSTSTVPDPYDPQKRNSLWWLPSLDQLINSPDRAKTAREDVLPSYRGPFPNDLIGRVECTAGHLRTFDFNRNMDGSPMEWRFLKPSDIQDQGKEDGEGDGSIWNRAISNSLALEFYDVRNEVRIELRRLANDVVVRNLILAPAPGASRPVLDILISNREPDLLFEAEGFSRSALPDFDFQAFYNKLSRVDQANDKLEELPIPYPTRRSLFGSREKPCAGAVMLGGGV